MRDFDAGKIVSAWLVGHGYDGLCNEECGCGVDDLCPCGELKFDCVPAYKRSCLGNGHCAELCECDCPGKPHVFFHIRTGAVLRRGRSMSDCECRVEIEATGPSEIVGAQLSWARTRIIFCPLHKAAPKMLAALKEIILAADCDSVDVWFKGLDRARDVVAEAEGGQG